MARVCIQPMTRLALAGAVSLAGVSGLAGCRGERTDAPPRQFFPDMDDSPRFRPQGETEFFADGRTQRKPVAGTVAYARWDGDVTSEEFLNSDWSKPILEERARLIKEDRELYFGSLGGDAATADFWLGDIPVDIDRQTILDGEEKFNIYCAACHGYEGDGNGMVGRRWSYPVPNLHDDKYQIAAGEGDAAERTGRDGYLFHVIRNGIPNDTQPGYYKMPPYSHALDENEAWAVVAYVRTLQASRKGNINDVPEQDRRRLNEMRGEPTAGPVETDPTGERSDTLAADTTGGNR